MTKLNKGDILTVSSESVAREYETCGDITLVQVETTEEMEDVTDLAKLSKMQVYKIVKNDVHEDLARHGVTIGHFSLQAIKVATVAFEETYMRINGEHDIPLNTKKKTPVLETYFTDKDYAHSMAVMLNKIEMKKMKQLNEATEKAIILLDQIIAKKYV